MLLRHVIKTRTSRARLCRRGNKAACHGAQSVNTCQQWVKRAIKLNHNKGIENHVNIKTVTQVEILFKVVQTENVVEFVAGVVES